jgi:hypothetical protein
MALSSKMAKSGEVFAFRPVGDLPFQKSAFSAGI